MRFSVDATYVHLDSAAWLHGLCAMRFTKGTTTLVTDSSRDTQQGPPTGMYSAAACVPSLTWHQCVKSATPPRPSCMASMTASVSSSRPDFTFWPPLVILWRYGESASPYSKRTRSAEVFETPAGRGPWTTRRFAVAKDTNSSRKACTKRHCRIKAQKVLAPPRKTWRDASGEGERDTHSRSHSLGPTPHRPRGDSQTT